MKNDSSALTWILLFRDTSFNDNTNAWILDSTIEYVILKLKTWCVFIYEYIALSNFSWIDKSSY